MFFVSYSYYEELTIHTSTLSIVLGVQLQGTQMKVQILSNAF